MIKEDKKSKVMVFAESIKEAKREMEKLEERENG
jgi:hypothetical protein